MADTSADPYAGFASANGAPPTDPYEAVGFAPAPGAAMPVPLNHFESDNGGVQIDVSPGDPSLGAPTPAVATPPEVMTHAPADATATAFDAMKAFASHALMSSADLADQINPLGNIAQVGEGLLADNGHALPDWAKALLPGGEGAAAGLIGGNYRPQTKAGDYAGAIGNALPNAFTGPEALGAKIASVALPGVASQGARDIAAKLGFGPTAQSVASAAGGLLGGMGAARVGVDPAPLSAITSGERPVADAVQSGMSLGQVSPEAVLSQMKTGALPAAASPGLRGLTKTVYGQPGPAHDVIADAISDRVAHLNGQVPNIFRDTLGVDPTSAADDINSIVDQGTAKAKPLYDALRANPAPVWSPRLEQLSQTPALRRAMGLVRENMANDVDGPSPDALGLSFMESPPASSDISPDPMPPGAASTPTRMASPGLARAPSRGPSLLQYIANNGGIRGSDGELAAMGADTWHVGKPFQNMLAPPGAMDTADGWAQRAQEAGYFSPSADAGPRQLYDAMSNEMSGRPLYARNADPTAQTRWQNQLDADRYGLQPTESAGEYDPSNYQGSPEPQTEPVPTVQPTADAWIRVHQALGRTVERDAITNKELPPHLSDTNANIAVVSRALRSELAGTPANPETGDPGTPGAIPGYRDALNQSGDYLSVKGAYNRASGLLFNGTPAKFSAMWNSLKTPGEQAGARAAIANDALAPVGKTNVEGVSGGQFAPAAFKSRDVQSKLGTAFGSDAASAFGDRMAQNIGERQSYQDVQGGSDTVPKAQLAAHFIANAPKPGGLAGLIGNGAGIVKWGQALMPHHWDMLPAMALEAGAKKAAKGGAPSGVLPWEDPATNTRLGGILSDPEAFQGLLGRMETQKANAAAAQTRSRQGLLQGVTNAVPVVSGLLGP